MTIKRSLVTEEKEIPNGVGKTGCNNVSKFAIPARLESLEGDVASTPSPVTAILRMEGGGDASYVKYSSGQANINAELRPMLADAIEKYPEFPTSGPIRVADLGCSVGANALEFAECITTAVLEKLKSQSRPSPEIHYFFSDLPSNDFNSLFLSLAPLKLCGDDAEKMDRTEEAASGNRKQKRRNYYAAAVPGSFYDRLFPQASLHVVMSAWSMHWLSHVSVPIIFPLLANLLFIYLDSQNLYCEIST